MHRLKHLVVGVLVASLWGVVPPCGAQAGNDMGSLVRSLRTQIEKNGVERIAILALRDINGEVTALGKYLADELMIAFVTQSPSFRLVDRANLQAILDEHELTEQGLVNPANAKKLGLVAGVDTLLMGSITPLESEYRISVKGISTESATIVAAGAMNLARSREHDNLARRGLQDRHQSESQTSSTVGGLSSASHSQLIGNLQVRLLRFELIDNGNVTNAVLEFSNRSQDNDLVFVGFVPSTTHHCGSRVPLSPAASVVDSAGREYLAAGNKGINYSCCAECYLRLGPGEKSIGSLRFEVRYEHKDRERGDSFSFSADIRYAPQLPEGGHEKNTKRQIFLTDIKPLQ